MKHRANSCYFYFPPCTGDPELGVELRLNVWSIWNRHPYPEVSSLGKSPKIVKHLTWIGSQRLYKVQMP